MPKNQRLVNDYVGVLNGDEANYLEQKLVAYNDSTSSQVAIVIENSTQGRETMEYAIDLFDNWNIGQKGKDNGVLIYLAIQDRQMAIVTGYGMEGAIPDAATYTIREQYMKPKFRAGDYFGGLNDATSIIFQLAAGEYTAEDLQNQSFGENRGIGIFMIIFIVVIILSVIFRNRNNNRSRGIGRPLSPFEMLILGSGMSRGGGNWSDFSGGSGGFGGFGGGMTGGGGSAGGW